MLRELKTRLLGRCCLISTCRKLEREAAARRAAEEKTEILESQADARRRELQELRNLVREGDEAKADLR